MARLLTRKLTLVELYAGTARSAEAFRQWNRVRLGLLVDNDSFAFETYLQNYPDAPYLVRSASSLTASAIRAYAGGRVDILLGCPPCQGFSDTGLRDPGDPRNAHLGRFARLAADLRPLAVGMENVPLAGNTKRFARFVKRMESLGYSVTWGVLNAALHGSAQCRHRLMMVGFRNDVGATPEFPKPTHGKPGRYWSYQQRKLLAIETDRMSMLSESPAARRARTDMPYNEEDQPLGRRPIPTLQDVWEDLPAIGSRSAVELSHYRWDHTPAMRRRMANVPEGSRWSGGADHFSHAYGRLHRRGLAHTLTTFFSNPGSGRYWHPLENRAISIREAARLQGFPDSFAFFPEATATCRLIGNALDAELANVTYRIIRDCLS